MSKSIKEKEKALVREIMNALGREPDVFVMRNEANVFAQLIGLIPGARSKEAYARILKEERNGLGVGSPDLVLVVRGWFLGLEVKRPKTEDHAAGGLSPGQVDWHAAAKAKGVMVRRVRSADEARSAVDEARRR